MSLNQLAIEAQSGQGTNISKQGLDQRKNRYAVEFLCGLLQKQLSNQIYESMELGLMKQFNRVRVKDSTKFDVHKQLQEWLPGFGGCASAASTCIQYEFDIKSGTVMGDFGVQNCIFTSKFLWEKHEFSIELGIWIWTFESISSC